MELNAADLRKMASHEVANLVDIDKWSVRNEGERRQAAAEKKVASLRKQLAKAEAEMAEAHAILRAAYNA